MEGDVALFREGHAFRDARGDYGVEYRTLVVGRFYLLDKIELKLEFLYFSQIQFLSRILGRGCRVQGLLCEGCQNRAKPTALVVPFETRAETMALNTALCFRV